MQKIQILKILTYEISQHAFNQIWTPPLLKLLENLGKIQFLCLKLRIGRTLPPLGTGDV